MKSRKKTNLKRSRRIARNRVKVLGTPSRPRLAVSRSNRYIYAQLIDDIKSHTLAQASSKDLAVADKKKAKTVAAELVGALLTKRAAEKGIKAAVLDRREYKYHGRVKALAESARKNGLKI